jgi:hypothetical protein
MECSEKTAHKIQTPGNYPKERIQHSEQGESLKSREKKMEATFTKVLTGFVQSNFHMITHVDVNVRQVLALSECI